VRRLLAFLLCAACGAPRGAEPAGVRHGGTPEHKARHDDDGDRDQLLDGADRCPAAAEDRDGFEDDDGCPDNDDDSDRIADADDRCPREPETANGHEDDDGCPDRCPVYTPTNKHCVLGPLFFARGEVTATFSKHNAANNKMLVELTAYAMRERPNDIFLVTLTGYRDRKEPRTLSRQRAEQLEQQLVDAGVEADRLEVVDGGIATHTDENRHRRVDLVIAKQRVAMQDSDDWECTPMGPLYIRLTDEQRKKYCLPPRTP
jgi:outer membrane protein OmpA-like peptidoglycan-associated protein